MWEEYYEMAHNHDEIAEGVEIPTQVSIKVGLMLLPGTVIAAAFADPLIDFVTNFCNATNVPSFFISFIAMPLATNSSEAVSAIIFASRKKLRTTSLTFSEVSSFVLTFSVDIYIYIYEIFKNSPISKGEFLPLSNSQ